LPSTWPVSRRFAWPGIDSDVIHCMSASLLIIDVTTGWPVKRERMSTVSTVVDTSRKSMQTSELSAENNGGRFIIRTYTRAPRSAGTTKHLYACPIHVSYECTCWLWCKHS
jgi:hypothetical protein